jgi:PTS system mannitol-specific IIC component
MRQQIQKFGRALSGMVMPNIGAFIAWGFVTALFIPSGWWPNTQMARLVDPMLTYLLPLLIAYTAGRNVAGERGGVIGAIAAMGVIVGSDIPMFIGVMVMGPLGGYTIRWFDMIKIARFDFIEDICKKRPANNKFKRGWMNRINDLRFEE